MEVYILHIYHWIHAGASLAWGLVSAKVTMAVLFVVIFVLNTALCNAASDPLSQQLYFYREQTKILHDMLVSECPEYATGTVNRRSAQLDLDVARKLFDKVRDDLIKCRTAKSGKPTTTTTTAMPVYKDCQDLYENGVNYTAIYEITPPNMPTFSVWCEFFDNHGWTVIQKRFDGSVDFNRGWDDYKNGFGYVQGEYWLGNDKIYSLTQTNQKLNVYMKAADKPAHSLFWNLFYISDESDKYRLKISGYSGDLRDWFHDGINIDGMQFTTKDQKNDNWSLNCADYHKGGWWYNNCHKVQLNGMFGSDGTYNIYTGYITRPSSPPIIEMRITRD